MPVTLIVESSDLKRLSKQVRQVGNAKQIRKDLLQGLRAGTAPATTRLRARALALPSRGRKHTGLRRKMAASVGTQVKLTGNQAGVTVRLSRTRLGPQASVALSTNKTNWRHPVYGNTKVWVTQRSVPGWFDRTVQASSSSVQRNLKGVIDKIEKDMSHN